MKKDKAGYQREEHKAEHHFERAVRYHDAKKNGEAIKELTKAISYNPLKYEYYYNLGTTYVEIGDYRNAYAWYKKCIPFLEEVIRAAGLSGHKNKRLADDVIMLVNLGSVFEQYDDPDAKRCLEAAIKINPNSVNARFNLGLYYCKRDLLEDAIPELKKAYTLDKSSSDTIECLAYAYHNVGMIDETIGLIEGYREDNPLTNGLLNILGAAYTSFDRTMSDSIKCFQEMVVNEPEKPFPHALLAFAYAGLKWKNEAYGEIDRAKALNKEENDKDTEELIKDVLEVLDDPEDDNKKKMGFYLLMLMKKKMKERK